MRQLVLFHQVWALTSPLTSHFSWERDGNIYGLGEPPRTRCLAESGFGISLADMGRGQGENWEGLQKSAACGKRCELEGKLAASPSARGK